MKLVACLFLFVALVSAYTNADIERLKNIATEPLPIEQFSEARLEKAAEWLRQQPEFFKGAANITQGEWCHRCPTGAVVEDGYLKGAYFKVNKPANWNGILLVWLRGYNVTIPDPQTIFGGPELEAQLTSLGYALAGSLFSAGGWAVQEGTVDTLIVTSYFYLRVCVPKHTILVGSSMGTVIGYDLIESPITAGKFGLYDGHLALCSIAAGSTQSFSIGLLVQIAWDAFFGWPADLWGPLGCPRNDINYATDVFPIFAMKLGNTDPEVRRLIAGQLRLFMHILDIEIPFTVDPVTFFGNSLFYATQLIAETQTRAGSCILSNNFHFPYEISDEDRADLLIYMTNDQINGYLAAMNAKRTFIAPAKGAKYLKKYSDYRYKPLKPVLAVHTAYDDLIVSNEVDYANRAITNNGAAYVNNWQYIFTTGDEHCDFTPEQFGVALTALVNWVTTGVKPPRSAFPVELGFFPTTDSSAIPWELSPVP